MICDRFIIGTETIHYLLKESIIEHNHRISVKSYETYYGKLTDEVKYQYMTNDGNLIDLLLSPQSRKTLNEYSTCSCYFSGTQPQMTKKDPPKFAIANGFVIRSLLEVLHWTSINGDRMIRKINDHEVTDLLKAKLAPVRPYGCVFSYSRGA